MNGRDNPIREHPVGGYLSREQATHKGVKMVIPTNIRARQGNNTLEDGQSIFGQSG